MTEEAHPIDVNLEQILPILAREIYTSPFAFLRENVQNAFDAMRLQRYREEAASAPREQAISITLEGNRLSISDSGIGMSRDDLAQFFWSIGKSGKHTSEARSAGVVGTFGIGGMANFGICSRLEVLTRTYDTSTSVISFAERNQLSATKDCVFYDVGPPEFDPGTTVTGTLMQSITVEEIVAYLEPIVKYLDIPVIVDGRRLNQELFPSVRRDEGATRVATSGPATATIFVRALQNGQADIEVEKFLWEGKETEVSAVFQTTANVVSAYQYGFMLANVPITTVFGLGGIIDSPVLRPTAGREAVTDDSRALVQHLVAAVELGLAEHISETPGLPERFSSFFRYLAQYGYWDLADSATVRVYGTRRRVPLKSMKGSQSGKVYFARDGHDQSIMQAYAEQQKVLVLLSSDGRRQKVERQYLQLRCNATPLQDRVTCLRVVEDLSFSETVLQFQLLKKLRTQFLIDGLHVRVGELSHGAMLWTPPTKGDDKVLFIDFRHAQVQRLIQLRESLSFDAVFDIFIRDFVLQHLEDAFPELQKRDFDALLRKLQSTVEYFEIDPGDIRRIQQLASITNMSPEDVAAMFGERSSRIRRQTSIGQSDIVSVTEQVNQAMQEAGGNSFESIRHELEIRLLETEVDAKLLDASEVQAKIGLSRYYLALTGDAHILYRRVFLERRPSTDFSWGGHRAGYLFYSHGESVVYYDIQFQDLLMDGGHERTGTYTLEHTPLVLKNMVFLPIPQRFEQYFVPTDRTLRFTVEHQILGAGTPLT